GDPSKDNDIALSSRNGPSIMERNADYAEELAKLQRQEYEAVPDTAGGPLDTTGTASTVPTSAAMDS
ncbi:hypothetical protein Tco_0504189, partial [Tanacetum coccineum]